MIPVGSDWDSRLQEPYAQFKARKALERKRRAEAPPVKVALRMVRRVEKPKPPVAITFVNRSKVIIAEVAKKHGVSTADMLGRSFRPMFSHPRQEVMYRLRHETKLSLPQIGELLDRDHTTVMAGVKAHAERLKQGREKVAEVVA